MDETNERSLQERIERLEAIVAELQKTVKKQGEESGQREKSGKDSLTKVSGEKPTGYPVAQVKSSSSSASKKEWSFGLPESVRSGEFWLNKVGIALLLFGVAFLFKYSIDQGWLTPAVRVAFGILLGIGLVVAGLRIPDERRQFRQVLIGGGIATFYITGFAAFQLLHLISHPVAFLFMVFVTVLSFVFSLRQEGVVLALIGVIGGLGTPFLLYTGSGNLPGLVGYTCLVIAGAVAIFFFMGWRSLLLTTVIGGWLVFIAALTNAHSTEPSDQWSLQLGLLFCWLSFWVLPLVRESIWNKNLIKWNGPYPDDKIDAAGDDISRHRYMHILTVSTPIIVLVMSMQVWSLSEHTWGWVAMIAAIGYGLISLGLSRRSFIRNLSYTHALVAVVFLTYSFYLLLHGDLLLFTLAVEAGAIHILANRLSDKWITLAAHILFGIVGFWLVERLFAGPVEGRFILNVQAVTDLWVIGIGSIVTIFYLSGDEKKVYFLFIHIAILGWFLRELSSIPHGQGYVTIAWGIYSVILLILALRLNDGWMRGTAMVTLFIVVGKLFLVDLAQLETIWRVLLFLGFGGLFLVLSYYFRTLWRSGYKSPEDKDNTSDGNHHDFHRI
ncbi:MAG TPA: DUF2339 domain-containing protein [Balneolales bacterium]|nr:DUF2339 domain-containing protein [Balneolales bacterium]